MLEHLHEVEERFWSRVQRTESCWIWTGARDRDGYGRVRVRVQGRRSRCIGAHRLAFALDRGEMPGPGRVICHRCDTPACVRPDHLTSGSHAENARQRVERGRCARGERNGRAKLTGTDVAVIRERLAEAASVRSVARAFDVAPRTIQNIRDGRNWNRG